MNDDLFQHLCQKDHIGFCKSWRKRFCAGNVKPTITLNCKQGDIEILHEFTEYYKKVSLPNTPNADDRLQQEVDQRLCGSFRL